MTEQDWRECTDPEKMLDFLRGRASARKLRLFAVACCRRVRHLLWHKGSRKALHMAERYADGLIGDAERERAQHRAHNAGFRTDSWGCTAASNAATCLCFADEELARFAFAVALNAAAAAGYANGEGDAAEEAIAAEAAAQSLLLRDLFGNPFRPVAFAPAWRTPQVVTLAQSIYEERAFDRLPELADALEAAGCTNPEILSHCRGPGPHARGCWLLDALLGKE